MLDIIGETMATVFDKSLVDGVPLGIVTSESIVKDGKKPLVMSGAIPPSEPKAFDLLCLPAHESHAEGAKAGESRYEPTFDHLPGLGKSVLAPHLHNAHNKVPGEGTAPDNGGKADHSIIAHMLGINM